MRYSKVTWACAILSGLLLGRELETLLLKSQDTVRELRATRIEWSSNPNVAIERNYSFDVTNYERLVQVQGAPAIAAIHASGNVTVGGTDGVEKIEDIPGGKRVYYKGPAVTCILYTMKDPDNKTVRLYCQCDPGAAATRDLILKQMFLHFPPHE